MANITTDIQVWFLRHGKTSFCYENSKYDDFIQMLCNPDKLLLAEDPGIDFKSLPKQADFIGYSPTRRAIQTGEFLRHKLDIKQMKKLDFLREVRFDVDLIQRREFVSLATSRKDILERWYYGLNKAETFEDSFVRVKEIESFLKKRQEKTIILVTHGWFLRLLEIYFVQGKHTNITYNDLLEVLPVPLGHCIKATVAHVSC